MTPETFFKTNYIRYDTVTLEGSLNDVVLAIKKTDAYKKVHDVCRKYRGIESRLHQINGIGMTMWVADMANCKKFAKRCLVHTRLSVFHQNRAIQRFGLEGIVAMKVYAEQETIEVITDVFNKYNPESQFPISSYHIDLYLHDLNIAVECDEYNHSSYDRDYDERRTAAITRLLGCQWIRYNPHATDFRLGRVIERISRSTERKRKLSL